MRSASVSAITLPITARPLASAARWIFSIDARNCGWWVDANDGSNPSDACKSIPPTRIPSTWENKVPSAIWFGSLSAVMKRLRAQLTSWNPGNFLHVLHTMNVFYLGKNRDVFVPHLHGGDARGQVLLCSQQRKRRDTSVTSWWKSDETDKSLCLLLVLDVRHHDSTSTGVQCVVHQLRRRAAHEGDHWPVGMELNRPRHGCNFRWPQWSVFLMSIIRYERDPNSRGICIISPRQWCKTRVVTMPQFERPLHGEYGTKSPRAALHFAASLWDSLVERDSGHCSLWRPTFWEIQTFDLSYHVGKQLNEWKHTL